MSGGDFVMGDAFEWDEESGALLTPVPVVPAAVALGPVPEALAGVVGAQDDPVQLMLSEISALRAEVAALQAAQGDV